LEGLDDGLSAAETADAPSFAISVRQPWAWLAEHGSSWFQGPMALVLRDARTMAFVRAKGRLGVFRCR
jgi:hypothetical protein